MRLILLGTMMAGVLAVAGPAAAQESNTIGPPALSEFELRPERTAPAEPEPIIAPLERPSAEAERRPLAAPPPVVALPAPAAPASRGDAPTPRRQAEAAPTPLPSPVQQPPAETVAAAPAASTLPEPEPKIATLPARTGAGVRNLPSLAPPSRQGTIGWWPYGLGAAAVALGLLLLWRRRRVVPAGAVPRSALRSPPPPPTPSPAPMPEALPRPRIEIEFVPVQAGANGNEAGVKFELMLRNVGESEARDVRVEARLFNAGAAQDREIGAFFAQPGGDGAAAPVPIAPQTQIPYRSAVTMKRSEVREVVVQGRRLFIPMIAFNILYRWGEDRTGQTSVSYLVGVEPTTPSEKMGAFRLDLGPRIYRSVGGRQHGTTRFR